MKLSTTIRLFTVATTCYTSIVSFVVQSQTKQSHMYSNLSCNGSGVKSALYATSPMQQTLYKAFASVLMTATFWTAPALIESELQQQNSLSNLSWMTPTSLSTVVSAKEMASGSGSRVNKDPESLLRLGLPIQNKEVRTQTKPKALLFFLIFLENYY